MRTLTEDQFEALMARFATRDISAIDELVALRRDAKLSVAQMAEANRARDQMMEEHLPRAEENIDSAEWICSYLEISGLKEFSPEHHEIYNDLHPRLPEIALRHARRLFAKDLETHNRFSVYRGELSSIVERYHIDLRALVDLDKVTS